MCFLKQPKEQLQDTQGSNINDNAKRKRQLDEREEEEERLLTKEQDKRDTCTWIQLSRIFRMSEQLEDTSLCLSVISASDAIQGIEKTFQNSKRRPNV